MKSALITRIFLAAFWIQGACALVEAAFFSQNSSLLHVYRLSSLPFTFMAAVLSCALLLSPRLPKRLLLAPVLFTLWRSLWALPLPVLFPKYAPLLTSGAQFILGSFLGFWSFSWADGQWHSALRGRPKFAWSHLLLALAGALLVALSFGFLCLKTGVSWVHKETDGYVQIQNSGILIEERRFQRDTQEIRLVGMIHIARPEFYSAIAESLPPSEPAVMLLEGVTDEQNLLQGSFSYTKVAEILGLTAQTDSDLQNRPQNRPQNRKVGPQRGLTGKPGSQIEYRHADVDLSELKPQTLQFLRNVGRLLSSNSLIEILQKLQTPEFQQMTDKETAAIMGDVVAKRNQRVLSEINEALPSGRTVLIPWGAMHLPEIQRAITKMGFQESLRIQRLAIPFGSPLKSGTDSLLPPNPDAATPSGEEASAQDASNPSQP